MGKQKKINNDKTMVRSQVKKILAEIARVDLEEVNDDANIRDEFGVDSVSSMEILAAVETRLGITIDEARAFNVVTVKDLIDLVIYYLEAK